MQRSLNAILGHAVTHAAHEIRLEKRGENLEVCCLCESDWQTLMVLNAGYASSLLSTIRKTARMTQTQQQGAFQIDLRDDVLGLRVVFQVQVKIAPDDTVQLHLVSPDEAGANG